MRLAFVLLVILVVSSVAAEERTLRVACFPNPPAFAVENGAGSGFFGDLTRALLEAEGYTPVWVPGTVADGDRRLKDGEVDLLPCTSVSPERQTLFAFGRESAYTGWGQVYVRQGQRAESVLDLAGRRVAVVRGNNTGRQFIALLEAFSVNHTLVEVDRPPEVFAALTDGRADAGVVNNLFGDATSGGFPVERTGILFHPFRLHFVVRKGEQAALLAALDARLAAWKADPHSPYHVLVDRWFAGRQQGGRLVRLLLAILGGTVALTLVAGGMVLLLRARVRVAVRDLASANAQLKESEERLQATLLSIGDAVIATDLEGRIARLNPVAERLTGWPAGEAAGHHLDEVFRIVNADTREVVESPAARVIATGEVVGLANHTVLLARDGVERQIADSGAPIRDRSGRVCGVVLVFRDVSAEYAMQERLRQGQKLEAIGQLAGGVAHDFNNLLCGIIAAAEMLRSSGEVSSPRAKEWIELILGAGERGAGLTRQILAFARKTGSQRVPIDLDQVVAEAVGLLSRSLDRRIAIEVAAHPGGSPVLGDAAQLEAVIINLALNARDAMPEGGRIGIAVGRIRLEAEDCRSSGFRVEPGPYALLSVTDHGCGMTPELQRRIFEPFFTTKASGKGTGLGLAMVYGTVVDHGGLVRVQSAPGAGSRFEVLLPLTVGVQKGGAAAPQPERTSWQGLALLVDDEAALREVVGGMLAGMGFEVCSAAAGADAIAIFRQRHAAVRVAVIDLLMPGMDGRQVARALRAMAPDLPLLFISGYQREVATEELLAAGGAAFLAKPFRRNDLLAALASLLGPGAIPP